MSSDRAVSFTKVQSIGNDFVLVEANHGPQLGTWSEVAMHLCARHTSVGSDGLLVVQPLANDRIAMRMFNPDGTEDFCGNGLRCAARYASDHGWVGPRFVIEHGGRDVQTQVDGQAIETSIGIASFEPAKVPHCWPRELFMESVDVGGETLRLSALTTGSTHVVALVDKLPPDRRFKQVSQTLENDPRFPERTSVIWMRSNSDFDLSIRIWERGVGETQGCGTGSSAAAVTQARRLESSGTFLVRNPGGSVQVTIASWDAMLSVRGEACVVFDGETL